MPTVFLVLAAAVGLVGGGLSACGASDGQDRTGPPNVTSEPPPARSAATLTPPRSPATTVTGTVSRGAVEGSCLVLTLSTESGASGPLYLLMGDSATLASLANGATVVLSGRPDPGVATTCQTGTPFVVEQVLSPSGSATS